MAAVRGRPSGLPGLILTRFFQSAYSCHPFRLENEKWQLHHLRIFAMFKPTPNPPETDTSSEASLEAEKLKEAADRVFSYYFPPHEKPGKRRKHHLFSVSPDIDTEALLTNASEDLLSISAIAADLADDVDGSRRSVALALSRMADGVQLLVERALDHHESAQMKAQAGA
jgi:hypothetical protein